MVEAFALSAWGYVG